MARNADSYQRRGGNQQGFPRVLIVPEGIKTETYYLHRLKVVHGLSSVEIKHSGGTDPQSIVDFALAKIGESDEWDRVYCVFDGDVDRHLANALTKLRNSDPGKAGKLHATLSVPCIEFWFLLHFVYTSKAYTRMASRTPCEAVQDDLKKHIPNYDKADKGLYDRLAPNLEAALVHGARLVKEQEKTGSANPITYMHDLVGFLTTLKKSD